MSSRFQLYLSNGVRLSHDMTPANVESVAGCTKSDMKTGYVWYSYPEVEIDRSPVCVALCFFGSQLETISLALTDSKYGTGWNDWSEEKERQRAKDTSKLLEKFGFHDGNYGWGCIWSGFEPKGGSGSTVITYKKGA